MATESAVANIWSVRDRSVEFSRSDLDGPAWLMGIVNATPDSFSDGGSYLDPAAAVAHSLTLVAEGARIIDVGGESTRPGAQAVPLDEELRRVVPVVRRLAKESSVLISIDTTKSAVARAALDAGAHIVNDISGLTFDPAMPDVCAAAGAGVICMHIRGTPLSMQEDPRYENVVEDVRQFLDVRMSELERLGVSRDHLVTDPGIGFGKTADHNLELLANIERFRTLGRPVCIGHSRKRFLKKLLGRPADEHPIDERLFATVGVAVAVALQGAQIIRVHDVAAVRDAILACHAILRAGNILPKA